MWITKKVRDECWAPAHIVAGYDAALFSLSNLFNCHDSGYAMVESKQICLDSKYPK